MFEKATKMKLRFESHKGYITTEDVWELPLRTLDVLAKMLNKQIKEEGEESFIGVKSNTSAVLAIKFAIVKRIIEVRLQEIDDRVKKEENQSKKARIMQLILEKQDDNLKERGVEELQKMFDAL